jgi:YhcH/YjgK/YiaL family protein
MIHDRLEHAPAYFNLSPGIRRALEYLGTADLEALAPGRHDVDGDRVFALVSDYDTRTPAETFWEAHRQHVDVQYVHRGVERIGVGDLSAFNVQSYDAERDLVVASGAEGQTVEVRAGEFVILLPDDVHMPGLTAQAAARVRKVVMKVRWPDGSVPPRP